MTVYTAPPTQLQLVLNRGDTLDVQNRGVAYDTMNNGAVQNVLAGGTDVGTTIDSEGGNAGLENVSGVATDTTIKHGLENVTAGGTAIHATIKSGGALWVSGLAIDTTINDGGVLQILGGTANNVTFGGPQALLAVVGKPSSLTGTISNWQVGDVVDFLNTVVTDVHQTGNKLTVTYGNQTTSYVLAGQEAHTEFKLQSDGNGGTNLILVLQPILNDPRSLAALNEASVQLTGIAPHLDHAAMI